MSEQQQKDVSFVFSKASFSFQRKEIVNSNNNNDDDFVFIFWV